MRFPHLCKQLLEHPCPAGKFTGLGAPLLGSLQSSCHPYQTSQSQNLERPESAAAQANLPSRSIDAVSAGANSSNSSNSANSANSTPAAPGGMLNGTKNKWGGESSGVCQEFFPCRTAEAAGCTGLLWGPVYTPVGWSHLGVITKQSALYGRQQQRMFTSREEKEGMFENEAPQDISQGMQDIPEAFNMKANGSEEGGGSDAACSRKPGAGVQQGARSEGGPGKGDASETRAETPADATRQSSQLMNEDINMAKHPPDGYSDLHAMNQYPPTADESRTAPSMPRGNNDGLAVASRDSSDDSKDEGSFQPWAGDPGESADAQIPPRQPMRGSVYVDGHAAKRKQPKDVRSEDKHVVGGDLENTAERPEAQSGG